MSKIPCNDCVTFACCNSLVQDRKSVSFILRISHCTLICDYFEDSIKRFRNDMNVHDGVRATLNDIRKVYNLHYI